jgi:hypothetical protein
MLFVYVQDVRTENCSCVFCIRAVRGAICRGRMDAHDCMDAGGSATQEQLPRSGAQHSDCAKQGVYAPLKGGCCQHGFWL